MNNVTFEVFLLYHTMKYINKNFSSLVLVLHIYSLFTIPLGTCKGARPVNAGSHYLHYNLNDLNAEKNPSPVVT